ncbi:hypothetical protein [Massilia endophytica]|uniref:hypothetical protein n=1 Tax=Massilia endophytica TaxID=2899220 RepID=UPI001E64DC62|nr:hypothetical protein [Massilia endophytica]UGQ47542.1 hypothetical protein LSQ66_03405 [Massilia endophytica]
MNITDFELRLQQLRSRLHRYCACMTGSAVDGEDVLQESLIKALRAHAEGTVVENFEGHPPPAGRGWRRSLRLEKAGHSSRSSGGPHPASAAGKHGHKLDLVNKLKLAGSKSIGLYFTRYAEETKWRFDFGAVEGRPAMLVFDSGGAMDIPSHFALLEWQEDHIATIRDFLFAPYMMEATHWVRLPRG